MSTQVQPTHVIPRLPAKKLPGPKSSSTTSTPAADGSLREKSAALLALILAWLKTNTHVAISAGVHLLLLLILGFIVWGSQTRKSGLEIETFFDQEADSVSKGLEIGENVGDLLDLERDVPNPQDAMPMAGLGGPILPPPGLGVGPLLGGAGKAGIGDGDPGGGDGSNIDVGGFFGTAAEGKTFVFIVDASGSMEENNRWGAAISELGRAIGKLKAHQSFYVYFFSDADKTFRLFDPRPARGLVEATAGNKSRAQKWIRGKNIRPGGLTNPEIALEEGIAMRPDVIFLMTDGEFDNPDLLAAHITKLNGGHSTIHTIALDNDSGETCLERIAKQNKGTYRFVKR